MIDYRNIYIYIYIYICVCVCVCVCVCMRDSSNKHLGWRHKALKLSFFQPTHSLTTLIEALIIQRNIIRIIINYHCHHSSLLFLLLFWFYDYLTLRAESQGSNIKGDYQYLESKRCGDLSIRGGESGGIAGNTSAGSHACFYCYYVCHKTSQHSFLPSFFSFPSRGNIWLVATDFPSWLHHPLFHSISMMIVASRRLRNGLLHPLSFRLRWQGRGLCHDNNNNNNNNEEWWQW